MLLFREGGGWGPGDTLPAIPLRVVSVWSSIGQAGSPAPGEVFHLRCIEVLGSPGFRVYQEEETRDPLAAETLPRAPWGSCRAQDPAQHVKTPSALTCAAQASRSLSAAGEPGVEE